MHCKRYTSLSYSRGTRLEVNTRKEIRTKHKRLSFQIQGAMKTQTKVEARFLGKFWIHPPGCTTSHPTRLKTPWEIRRLLAIESTCSIFFCRTLVPAFRYWGDIKQKIQPQEGLKRVFRVNCISIIIQFFKRRNLSLLFVGLRLTGRARTRLNKAYQYIQSVPGGNVPDFGRLFLKLKYTDLTKNTYIRSWTVTEIMAREVWKYDSYYTLIDYQIHIKTGRNMWFL